MRQCLQIITIQTKFMKKKLIFLDGDGTLWYPSSTKRTKKSHWIYSDPATRDNYLEHMELTPKVKEALLKLNGKGITLVVLSASPHPTEVANRELREKLEFFDILKFFDSYHSSPGDRPDGKGALMLKLIESHKLTKKDALMIGDSFFYDYLAAKDVGVDAYLIENQSSKMPTEVPEDLQVLREVIDIMDILENG